MKTEDKPTLSYYCGNWTAGYRFTPKCTEQCSICADAVKYRQQETKRLITKSIGDKLK